MPNNFETKIGNSSYSGTDYCLQTAVSVQIRAECTQLPKLLHSAKRLWCTGTESGSSILLQ